MKDEQLKISKMSGKLKGMRALNTNTLTNEFCSHMYEHVPDWHICGWCFSQHMLRTHRKNCEPAWQHNSDLLCKEMDEDDLPILNDVIFRGHGHGELQNLPHLINFHWIAIINPDTTIALWSKRKDIVHKYLRQYIKPSNLILVYSHGAINKPLTSPPKGFDKVFQNVSPQVKGYQSKFKALENCTGRKCLDCRLCYTYGTDVITEAVKLQHKRKQGVPMIP